VRRALCLGSVFLAGLLVGGLAIGHVWVGLSRALLESTLTEYQHEQQLLAARARRSGNTLRHALHAMNVADSQADLGFRWLQRARSDRYWDWFRFPWSLYPLICDIDPYLASRPDLERGRDSLEATYRAQAAIALESLDRVRAEEQWSLAAELKPGWPRERLRAVAESWGCDSEQTESAWLDSKTREELGKALERLRAASAPQAEK
jgi:hypothetical protein